MDRKEELKTLLKQLKDAGIDRRDAERALDMSVNYLDQQVSKGGNDQLISRLRGLLDKATMEIKFEQKISTHLSNVEKRMLIMESKLEVLGQYVIEVKHKATGESTAKISLEMEKTTREFLEHRLGELSKK
jgi:hypothetical protein